MRVKVPKSIFFKMLLSYNIVVLLIVFIATSLFEIYSSNEFYRQAVKSDSQSLGYLGEYMNSDIFENVENLYVKMSLENSPQSILFDTSVKHNDVIATTLLHKEVINIVQQNADILNDVHFYYPYDETMISSRYGIKYFSDRSSINKEDIDWLLYEQPDGRKDGWMGRDIDDHGNNDCITLVKKYPFATWQDERAVIVAFDVDVQKMKSIMTSPNSGGIGANTVILDGKNNIISCSIDEDELGDIGNVREILSSYDFKGTDGSFECKIKNTKSVVSYKKIGRTSWSIVIISSMSHLGKAFNQLKSTIALICVFVIFIGIALSVFFSRKFYRPIGAVAAKIKEELSVSIDAEEGEHEFIDRFVGNLIERARALDDIRDTNSSLVKHNIIIRLINNSITEEDFDKYLKFIEIELKSCKYYVALITFDKEMYEELSIDTKEFIKYDTISFIENLSDNKGTYIATDTVDGNLCVLINSDSNEGYIAEKILDMVSYINTNYRQNAFASVGRGTDKKKIYQSYKTALTSGEYHYFKPMDNVITYKDIEGREKSGLYIDESCIAVYENALESTDGVKAEETLGKILELMVSGNYSAQTCNDYLLRLMFAFSRYIKKENIEQDGMKSDDIREQILQIADVYQFITMLSNYTKMAFSKEENRAEDVNIHMVSAIKNYCSSHLGEDLSLTVISRVVYVSARHANKIFKQETGMNITEYVLNARLEKAKELLVTTNKKVEEISELVGFNTPHYFIKKFKEKNNTTPNMYRKYSS